jgi:hypothetical protein
MNCTAEKKYHTIVLDNSMGCGQSCTHVHEPSYGVLEVIEIPWRLSANGRALIASCDECMHRWIYPLKHENWIEPIIWTHSLREADHATSL